MLSPQHFEIRRPHIFYWKDFSTEVLIYKTIDTVSCVLFRKERISEMDISKLLKPLFSIGISNAHTNRDLYELFQQTLDVFKTQQVRKQAFIQL